MRDEARRYYTNIVGKYGAQVQAVLQTAAGLDIRGLSLIHILTFWWFSRLGKR